MGNVDRKCVYRREEMRSDNMIGAVSANSNSSRCICWECPVQRCIDTNCWECSMLLHTLLKM